MLSELSLPRCTEHHFSAPEALYPSPDPQPDLTCRLTEVASPLVNAFEEKINAARQLLLNCIMQSTPVNFPKTVF